ncbi:MAG: peptidoglycan-binding domain-containing protein [Bacteroidota bacterium]
MSSICTFEISDTLLRRVCESNNFSILNRENEMILFGIRGALPAANKTPLVDYTGHTVFKDNHTLIRVEVNYYYPRCILGQWLPSEKKVAVFPGSTVPNLKIVQRNRKQKYQFNCMLPGYHTYRKGQHPKSDSGFQPHKALRLTSPITLRRANYTLGNGQPVINYGPTAATYTGNPGDNIHCARNNTKTTLVASIRGNDYSTDFCMSDYYGSYGCQVILGCPEQYIPSAQANGSWNAWHTYVQNIYERFATEQTKFKYILLNSYDVHQISKSEACKGSSLRVLHGSTGWMVEELQKGLKKVRSGSTGIPYYKGIIDGDFQTRTAQALIHFQKDHLGGIALGYAGENTLSALGIPLHSTA